MNETTYIPSAFPITIRQSTSGVILLKSVDETVFSVTTKDNLPLSAEDIQYIIDKQLGLWDVGKKYKVVKFHGPFEMKGSTS